MVMIFANPKVRAYLLKHRLVHTFRKHHKKTTNGVRPQIGKDWACAKRTGKKIADIYIMPMMPVNSLNMREVLGRYVRDSGFYDGQERVDDAISEWISAINSLNLDEPIKGWIYKVLLREV